MLLQHFTCRQALILLARHAVETEAMQTKHRAGQLVRSLRPGPSSTSWYCTQTSIMLIPFNSRYWKTSNARHFSSVYKMVLTSQALLERTAWRKVVLSDSTGKDTRASTWVRDWRDSPMWKTMISPSVSSVKYGALWENRMRMVVGSLCNRTRFFSVLSILALVQQLSPPNGKLTL